jgi:hypothetical protein
MCVTRIAHCVTISAVLAAFPGPSSAATLPAKVWVAHWGHDGAACGAITSPCASLQRAHDNVAAGGEVTVLAPGDYGGSGAPRLSIRKSISINYDGPGEAGIIGVEEGPAVSIAAGPRDVISLRGLVLDGQSIGTDGIQIRGAAAVHVRNCVIRNFEGPGGGVGIRWLSHAQTRLFVSDTLITKNGSSATTGGMSVHPHGSASAVVVLDRVILDRNVIGVSVDGTHSTGAGAHVIIRDSVLMRSAMEGILARSAPGRAPISVIFERSASVDNFGSGVLADGPRTMVLLRDSIATGNETAFSVVNFSQLVSFGGPPERQQYRSARQPESNLDPGQSAARTRLEIDDAP